MGRDGTLKVSKLVNLTIQNLKSSGNRDNKVSGNTSSTITSIVFDQHKSCADDFSSDCSSVLTLAPYVTKGYTITLTSQQPISCLLNVLLSENVLVTVTGSEFKTNECSEKDEQDPTYTMESSVLALNSTVEGDVISIANTVFDRNSAVREVSDLRLDIMSDIVLDTLTFQYGISQVYGAVFIQNTKQFKVEIRASTFTSNQGGISGGAHIEAGYAKLDGVTFTSNQSQRGGGFGYRNTYDGNVQLHIMNCVFTSNEATTGGAISIDDTAVTGRQHFDISATTFTSNVADYASIVNVETTVTLDVTQASLVRDCTFTSNNSRVQGGIVFASREGSITISTCTFNSNSGISGLALQFATSSQVSLTTSTFLNNSGESIISIDSFADQVIGVTQSSFTSNSGSCIYATSATLTESENTYSSNRYIIGAALLLNDAVCNASENVYTGNTAYESGGAVFVRTNASYKCEYCDMTSNTAYQGGFAYGEINSKIQIMHSRLSKNSATEQGSAIMMNTCLNDSTFINNTVWENEVGYTGTMYFLKSQMAINDTVMYNNIEKTSADSRQTPGIVGILSTITVYNSYFYNQKSTQGGSVFHISTESSLRVEQTTITNINTEDSGAVLFCLSSNATFISTTMSGLTAFSGGFALLNQNSILNLESGTSITTVSASESDSIVSAFDSTINLSGSTFTGFDNTGIFGSSLKGMTIDNCSFINSMSKEFNGGAISCDKCDAMTVRNSKFTNSTSPLGGAIYISNERSNILDGSFSITNNEFDSNQAGQGGALWADNSNILIHNNVFKNNSAGFYDFPVTISNEQESGGGVRLICTRWTTCTYDLNANTFDGNRGANSGGAISWDGTKPDGLEANTFENNEASYGAALASYPTHLVAVDENNQPLSRRLQDSNSTSITTMSNVQSGSVTDIVLRAALTDEAGTIITNDNTSTALLLSPDDGVSLTGTLQVTAVNGIFVFDNFAVIADPGTKVSFQIQTSAIELGKQNVDQNTFPIEVELRQCQIGEVLIGQSCDRCDQNTYSLDLDDTFCQDCYSDASCPGGYYILPDAGFWRPNEFYDGIFKCPNEDACLGSDNATQSLTGECATGYSGNMCQACDKDYSAGAANKCLACLDDGVNAVRLIATAIALVAIVGIMVRSSMLSAYKPKAEHSIYLKIFANYLQLVILTESFDLNWPAQVLEMREAHETAGSAGDHIISFDCYFMGEGDDASIDVYFDKLILWAVLPAGLIFCNFIIWGLMASAKRNNQILRREAVTSLVILYFLIHPDLVKQFFFALSCREIEPGERWLSKNYDIKCWEGDHLFYVLVVILPSVIVWGMGLPCVFLGMLYKNRDVLHKFGMKAKYGFLYIGYEPQAFFWEFVILYRKILIVSILVFVVPESTAVAGLCCLVVLLGSLHIQTRFLPFEKPTYNSMELRSLGVATITIYCGLFYLTDDVSNNGKLFLLAIMIISNFFFLLDWLSKMFSALFNLLREKVPFLRKCLGTPIQQDGYGDALIVKRAAHPHYWKHGTENQYSLISNLEEPLAYDKTLKIPGSITELALQDLDKARDPVDNTHREVEGQYTFGENEYPKHVTNPSVRNSDENFHSPYHESRAALQSSREKSINSARSNDRTINSARDSQESKPKSNSILDQSMHTEIDEPTLPGPVKEEQDSVKEESGSRRSTPDLDEKENQRIDE